MLWLTCKTMNETLNKSKSQDDRMPCPDCGSLNTGLLEQVSDLKTIDTYRCFNCECVFEVHEKLVMEGDRIVRKEYKEIE